MSELLVHIGLHRTGSTWFQQTALPDEGTPIVDAWPDRADLARKIIKPCNADFAENVLRMELDSRCEAVRSTGDIPVLSHERFSGNPSSGAFDMSRTAERLQRLCPDAKILVILRDQQSQLESIWCQAVRIGLYCSADDYLRPHHPGDFRVPHFEPSYLLHDEIVGEACVEQDLHILSKSHRQWISFVRQVPVLIESIMSFSPHAAPKASQNFSRVMLLAGAAVALARSCNSRWRRDVRMLARAVALARPSRGRPRGRPPCARGRRCRVLSAVEEAEIG